MSKYSAYSELEEKVNVYSHTFGFLLSIIAFVLLFLKGLQSSNLLNCFAYCTFTTSMMFLYFSSANYHNTKEEEKRYRLKIVDHCAIYTLIAGSYTPFALITMIDTGGWVLFFIAWALAIIGITVKLYFTGRFKTVSTLMYVVMGWLIVFVAKPIIQLLPENGIYWLIMGGLFYTFGALLYSIKQIPLNHGIFHLFVLAGSICHFLSIYWYVN